MNFDRALSFGHALTLFLAVLAAPPEARRAPHARSGPGGGERESRGGR
jgi:hypothetical protein